jgi:curved DNA-binding protein CbpA
VTDCFALLNEPRRPWINPEALKKKFLTLSAEVHPDRVHSAGESEKSAAQKRYTELNAAYNRLREPKERLLHLLELELGSKPAQVQPIPPDLLNLFMEIGQLTRQADSFLAEKAKTTSSLLQVQLFEKSQEWSNQLMALQQRINSRREELDAELIKLDERWNLEATNPEPTSHRALLQRIEEVYRLFSYFARWSAQVQERIVQLSF